MNSNKLSRWILYLILAALTIVLLPSVIAVCCSDGVCHSTGVCSGGKWYQGCDDGYGQIYTPGQVLDFNADNNGCLACWCDSTDPSKCEWRPRNDVLCASDEVCLCNDGTNFGLCSGLTSAPVDSVCFDRDTSQAVCEWNSCGQGVTTPGTWVSGSSCCAGDDPINTETCFTNVCNPLNYKNPACKVKVTGKVHGPGKSGAIPGGATIKLRGKSNNIPIGYSTKLDLSYEGSSDGDYTVQGGGGDFVFPDVYGGATYEVVVTAQYYGTKVISPVYVAFSDYDLGTIVLDNDDECRPDCTKHGEVLCSSDCFGHPGCGFFSRHAASVCDERIPSIIEKYKPNPLDQLDPYNQDEYVVECCEGRPVVKGDVEVAGISVGGKDIVRTERFVWYRGRTIKVIVDSFG